MALWRPGHHAPGWVTTDLLWPHMLTFRSLVCRDSNCSFLFFNLFCWSRVDLHCCVNVYCTVKWFRSICVRAKSLIHVWLFATLWAVACQTPLSMGCSRQEYWSGVLCPPLGDLLDPGTEPASCAFPALLVDSLLLRHQGIWKISFSYPFPLWFITGYSIQFPVLYSRTLFTL